MYVEVVGEVKVVYVYWGGLVQCVVDVVVQLVVVYVVFVVVQLVGVVVQVVVVEVVGVVEIVGVDVGVGDYFEVVEQVLFEQCGKLGCGVVGGV